MPGSCFTRRGSTLAALLLAGAVGADSSAVRSSLPAETPAQAAARDAMVRDIRAMGVTDSATLSAMRAVPRHLFVLAEHVAAAYGDHALPIERGQTISQPFIVAFMSQAAAPRPGAKVLEIGTGSGYQAAVLAQMGCAVFTIEIDSLLAATAKARLARLGYRGIEVRHGDGYLGWPQHAPFDAILVTAAPPSIPPALVEQLAPGGRMVVPVGEEHATQTLTLVTKDAKGGVRVEKGIPVRFVPMVKGKR
jgi:protein-L-isoaspartate(D-aspartate) O-methyltransferase